MFYQKYVTHEHQQWHNKALLFYFLALLQCNTVLYLEEGTLYVRFCFHLFFCCIGLVVYFVPFEISSDLLNCLLCLSSYPGYTVFNLIIC